MKQFAVTLHETYQTTEDTWRRKGTTKLFDVSSTFADVMEWVRSKGKGWEDVDITPLEEALVKPNPIPPEADHEAR